MKRFIISVVFLSFMSFSGLSFAFFKNPFNPPDKTFEIKVLEMIKYEFSPAEAKSLPKKDLLIKRLKELEKESRLI